MPSFLVTGHGRSGTKFLAEVLNTSPTWRVVHEAWKPPFSEKYAINILAPSGNFGEVNSYLRYIADRIAWPQRKAIILRDPFEIALSAVNKGTWKRFIDDAPKAFEAIDRLAERDDFQVIRFKLMVSDRAYLARQANLLGVMDAKIGDLDLDKKVNSSGRKVPSLNGHQKKRVSGCAGWFKEKWFP